MANRSQRPIVAKVLGMEPMTIGDVRYHDLDHVLEDMGRTINAEEIVEAMKSHGIAVSVTTLYRWRQDVEE